MAGAIQKLNLLAGVKCAADIVGVYFNSLRIRRRRSLIELTVLMISSKVAARLSRPLRFVGVAPERPGKRDCPPRPASICLRLAVGLASDPSLSTYSSDWPPSLQMRRNAKGIFLNRYVEPRLSRIFNLGRR